MYLNDIRPLTSLRIVSALWVLVYHFRDRLGLDVDRLGLVAKGYLGVDLFFILSGRHRLLRRPRPDRPRSHRPRRMGGLGRSLRGHLSPGRTAARNWLRAHDPVLREPPPEPKHEPVI